MESENEAAFRQFLSNKKFAVDGSFADQLYSTIHYLYPVSKNVGVEGKTNPAPQKVEASIPVARQDITKPDKLEELVYIFLFVIF